MVTLAGKIATSSTALMAPAHRFPARRPPAQKSSAIPLTRMITLGAGSAVGIAGAKSLGRSKCRAPLPMNRAASPVGAQRRIALKRLLGAAGIRDSTDALFLVRPRKQAKANGAGISGSGG